jgi:hypothetical protein
MPDGCHAYACDGLVHVIAVISKGNTLHLAVLANSSYAKAASATVVKY